MPPAGGRPAGGEGAAPRGERELSGAPPALGALAAGGGGPMRTVKVKDEVWLAGLPPSLYGGMWPVVSGSSAQPGWLSLRLYGAGRGDGVQLDQENACCHCLVAQAALQA